MSFLLFFFRKVSNVGVVKGTTNTRALDTVDVGHDKSMCSLSVSLVLSVCLL